MPAPEKYRFRNRLPKSGEGKQPKAEVVASAEDGVALIRLYDVIDSWGGYWGVSAKEFAETLDGLDADVSEIRLHINSPGGEVFEAVAILNLLRNHKARVVSVVDGLAASAASFIACGADELIMGENSQLMIHDAWGVCIGNAADMTSMAGLLDHLSDNVASIYAAKSETDREGWRAAMLAETWYSPDEAVEAGLADRAGAIEESGEPVQIEKDAEPDVLDAFDTAALGFKYAGRNEAPDPTAARVEPTEREDDLRRHKLNELSLRK